MSFELDINGLINQMKLDEGLAKAKQDFVETKRLTKGQFSKLMAKDPTRNSKRSPYKYIEWIANQYVTLHIRGTDMFDILAEFDDLVNKNKITQKDIFQYKTLEEVTDAVHAAHAKMSEDDRLRKEKVVRNALISSGGMVTPAYHIVNRKHFNKSDDDPPVWTPREDVPEIASREFITRVRDKMAAEEAGATWRDFSVDTDIFNHIREEDIVYKNEKVVIVEPKSKAWSQLYGRNVDYDPEGPRTNRNNSSFWCVSYAGSGCLWDSYAYYDTAHVEGNDELSNRGKSSFHKFYVVLPRSIEDVPDKLYSKLMIQAMEGGDREVWDTSDQRMSDDDIRRVFAAYGNIPWAGKRLPKPKKEES